MRRMKGRRNSRRVNASNVGELTVKEAIDWVRVLIEDEEERILEKSSTGSSQTRFAAHIKLS